MKARPEIPLLLDVLEGCSAEESTRLGVAFAQVTRYYTFLLLILDRYKAVSKDYKEKSKASLEIFERGSPSDSFNEEESAILDEGAALHWQLHLEIESFYLFAKIFLDKIANFLEFYFESARGLSLDSHDQLVKNFASFCESKGLPLLPEFLNLAEALKASISDHRDYQIAHDKSPRTTYGTMYDLSTGVARISKHRLNPAARDRQIETAPLDDLFADAIRYMKMAVQMVKDKQREKLMAQAGDENLLDAVQGKSQSTAARPSQSKKHTERSSHNE